MSWQFVMWIGGEFVWILWSHMKIWSAYAPLMVRFSGAVRRGPSCFLFFPLKIPCFHTDHIVQIHTESPLCKMLMYFLMRLEKPTLITTNLNIEGHVPRLPSINQSIKFKWKVNDENAVIFFLQLYIYICIHFYDIWKYNLSIFNHYCTTYTIEFKNT